jgi:hypothetical protein
MSERAGGHHVPEDSGVERQEASEEFFGEFGERQVGDSTFEGERGEREHEGRENVSREASEEGPLL